MRCFTVLLSMVAACTAVSSISEEWSTFKTMHGKSYESQQEENFRHGVYLSNKKMIEDHNVKFSAGLVSYELKLNHFGDRLPEEVTQVNGFNRSGEIAQWESVLNYVISENPNLPRSVDWRQVGAVTPVKDQGHCAACWAFSAAGSLEGQVFRRTGRLISMSEQNLVDCTGADQSYGCQGGFMDVAFQYIIANGGVDSEESYPYEGAKGPCRFKRSAVIASALSYFKIVSGNEEALKEAVAMVGPISVAINVHPRTLIFYRRGVYNDPSCDPGHLNHGVLLVGYGTENGQDYWLIKNSWSTRWGENGYVKIARNQENLCGVASVASFPVVQ